MEEVEKTRNRRGNRKKMKGEDSMQGKKLDSPLPEERQVGDGAPAESANEATLPDETATDAEEQEFGAETEAGAPLFHLRLEVDVVCIALFLVALFTRLHRLDEPRSIVFDELHYGRYVSLYTRGVFFFDSHPPLGKQLLYAAARAAGYDGNFTFDKIGTEYAPSVPVWALRFPSALAGSLLVPLAYQLAALLCASRWSAALAGLLVLCDNALLVQSRFALLEPLLLAFSLSGVLCAVRAARARAAPARALWLTLAAAALACCFSVKFVGFYSYLLGVFLIGREFWGLLPKKEHSAVSIVLNFAWRSLTLVAVPLAVYLGVFYVHLSLLTRAGPHDSVMTSAFQASLEGGLASITKGQPLHVAHGSQITLRHTHGRMCWLHSHAHVYPVRYTDARGSSHQQQVTCYSFKDVNNWWIVKRPDKSELAVERPVDRIRHGEVVQLVHGITSRALNSHDVAAPVTPQAQEVSCYIDYNVSMPAQNLWRVEIVNRAGDDATWDTIQSLVRLVHTESGAALRFSGRQLPAWGFHQHEVVADKALAHPDTVWNVEEHRYTKTDDKKERERQLVSAEMIPTAATQLSFWDKFSELQHKMLLSAADAVANHMFSSEPLEWPFLTRGIAYWVSPHSNAQVHLIGNLVTWYSSTVALLLYFALLGWYVARRRRARRDLTAAAWRRYRDAGYVLVLGYFLHYLPYFFVERTLFLHHYLPAYLFKILVLVFMIEHVHEALDSGKGTRFAAKVFVVGVAVWAAWVVRTFERFSVLNYGTAELSEGELVALRWRDTWDFILHKK